MKHAICIISSLGDDYLLNCINQFENDNDFYFFVHTDLYESKLITDNILYIGNYKHAGRFTIYMVDVMMFLIDKVNCSDIKFDYIHFFSDTCRIIVNIDAFKTFFSEHNGYSFVEHDLNEVYKINDKISYKGSQWMSLHCSIFNRLTFELYNQYTYNIESTYYPIAYDEILLQTIIKYNFDNKLINNPLRYYAFDGMGHAVVLTENFFVDKKSDIQHIKNDCLIVRKLDFKNENYNNVLSFLKTVKSTQI